jgi:hypothetical protein
LEDSERFALGSLRAHIRKVLDRRSPHGKVHDLHAVLCLVLVALLCTGAKSVSQVVAFALGQGARRRRNGPLRRAKALRERREKPEAAPWLSEIGLVWRGAPTVPCVGRMIVLLGGVTVADLSEAMSGWLTDLLAHLRTRRVIGSVDGKSMRAGGRHVLSVFLHDIHQVALSLDVDDGKKNELSAFRDAVAALFDRYPGLWLLVGDAMFADKKLCEMINGRDRHWLFQIKENQPDLLEKMRLVFSPIVRREKPDATSGPEKRGTMWRRPPCGSRSGRAAC